MYVGVQGQDRQSVMVAGMGSRTGVASIKDEVGDTFMYQAGAPRHLDALFSGIRGQAGAVLPIYWC